jgi:hypothetical protein
MPNDILRQTQAAIAGVVNDLQRKKMDADKQNLISSINGALGPLLIPYLNQIVQNSSSGQGQIKQAVTEALSELKTGIKDALSNLKLDNIVADIRLPEIQMPNIPDVRVNIDTAGIEAAVTRAVQNVRINVPPINVPPLIMPNSMNVGLDAITNGRPLPVRMMDEAGKPFVFTMPGGGKMDFLTIKGIMGSAFGELVNPDGRLLVATPVGASGLTNTELRAASIDVQQASGAIWSVSVVGASGSTGAALIDSSGVQYSGSNPLPVVFGATATQGVNVVDSSGIAYSGSNPIPVVITSGASATSASNIVDSSGIAYSGSNPLPTYLVTDATATVNVVVVNSAGDYRDTFPISGSVEVSGVTNSIGATILNGEGLARDSWLVSGVTASVGVSLIGSDGLAFGTSKPIPVTMVAGVSGTTGTANVDSSGVQYSGSNPMPVYLVLGAGNSSISVGASAVGVSDDGSAPNQIGGIARTANPTAVNGGQVVKSTYDDLGRQVMRPLQVRDLMATAYVSLTTGTETTFLAATAGKYFDLVYVMASNTSDVAATISLRGVTAGNILMTLRVPANGIAGISLPVPLIQQNTSDSSGNNWTVDMDDITGTTVYMSGLFTNEV